MQLNSGDFSKEYQSQLIANGSNQLGLEFV